MIIQLKIQIKDISKPPVWRRVLVPSQFTFGRLHNIIQAAFGWENGHFYLFSPKGYGSHPCIGIDEEDWATEDIADAEKVRLDEFLNEKGQTFTYIYDFGDDWIHKITVEEVFEEKAIQAELLAGKGACPPEDCGGVWGYQSLLEILSDPGHEMHEEMREWLGLKRGENWDTMTFDLATAKNKVAAR